MWNSSDAALAEATGPVSAGTVLDRLAAELLRSRAGLLALENSITAVTRSIGDPDILHALQGLDLLGQELDAYAGICGRLSDGLPTDPCVDAAELLGTVTLDGVKAGMLGRAPSGPATDGDADFF